MERANSEKGIGPVRRFGRYTLVKRLATGGMAEIWLARQTGLAGFNRFVVIKKILSHLSEQKTFVEMFLDEARTSAQLNHPNIVQIYDLGREGDSYFIAMEHIAGENLAAIAWRGMQLGRPVPVELAARIMADACKALHYAHHLRGSDGRPLEIVHRDVSPQNLLVTYDGEVKVVDFGIAKAATKNEQTKTGMLKGKFSYMSPEQCLGAPVDMRSDIFALGILSYELVTRKRLFKHESELMILEMITKSTVRPPSQLVEDVPAELDPIVMRALEKEAADRYPDARAMQLDLEAFLRRREGATHADLAAYMRALFSDRIEEKRRLIEIASRDDFESRFGAGSEAGTERPVVRGLSPSALASAPPAPRATTDGRALASGSRLSETRALPTRARWGSWFLGALALVAVPAAASVVWQRWAPSGSGVAFSVVDGPRGRLSLDSIPSGATIYLDRTPMRLPDGAFAHTPADIGPLQYGRTYALELRKEGYEPYREDLEMGEDLDGAKLHPRLHPLPGRLVVRVEGAEADQVRIFVDDQVAGRGPRVEHPVTSREPLALRAEMPGRACEVEPPRAQVPPGGAVAAVARCRPARVGAPAPRGAPRRAARRGERSAAPMPRRPGTAATAPTLATSQSRPERPRARAEDDGGCRPDPDLPSGFVTIDTRPHSQIFWRGRRIGETPLARYPLPSGCIELEARGEATRKSFKVEVQPNQVAIYRLDLD